MDSEQALQTFELPSKRAGIARVVALHKRHIADALAVAAAKRRAEAEVGDLMDDGTILAGVSPTTGERMYAAPADTLSKSFNEAVEGAETFKVGALRGFRVPDEAELQVLYENRREGALSGTFEEEHSRDYLTTGWYWSSKLRDEKSAYGMWFSRGTQVDFGKHLKTFVRYVR